MATTVSAVRSGSSSLLRQGGVALGAGSLVGTAIAVVTSTVAPQWATPGTTSFGVAGVVLTIIHLASLFAVVTLAASVAARAGWLKNVGFALTLAGQVAQALGESVIRFDMTVGNAFFTVCMPLMGLGMILVGIAVIRTGTWSSWRRFMPIACGLYIPIVLVPAFVIEKGPSFPALAGFGAVYALLGLAMFIESSRNDRRQVEAA